MTANEKNTETKTGTNGKKIAGIFLFCLGMIVLIVSIILIAKGFLTANSLGITIMAESGVAIEELLSPLGYILIGGIVGVISIATLVLALILFFTGLREEKKRSAHLFETKAARPTSLSIASMVFGLFSFLLMFGIWDCIWGPLFIFPTGLFSLLATVLGTISLARWNKNPSTAGHRIAMVGFALGVIVIILASIQGTQTGCL